MRLLGFSTIAETDPSIDEENALKSLMPDGWQRTDRLPTEMTREWAVSISPAPVSIWNGSIQSGTALEYSSVARGSQTWALIVPQRHLVRDQTFISGSRRVLF
jgi:hypothetical protein